ncbi:MAG: hypothetical protein HY049_20070 [Acidobacteria bacterium]|nr:hypothetical protein [Acidobacteriota bacterium]
MTIDTGSARRNQVLRNSGFGSSGKSRSGFGLVRLSVPAISVGIFLIGPVLAEGAGSPKPKETTGQAKTEFSVQGQIGVMSNNSSCKNPKEYDDADGNQSIKIIVSPPTWKKGPRFAVRAEPECAKVRGAGRLTFILDTSGLSVGDWDANHDKVEIEFAFAKNQGSPMKGPYNQINKVPLKRGRYENLTLPFYIDKSVMDPNAAAKSLFGFSVHLWRDESEFLGGVDPGIMVVVNP